jgi:hypothetical protein
VDYRDEQPQLIADSLKVIEMTERPPLFEIRVDDAGEDILAAVKAVLLSHAGFAPVGLRTEGGLMQLPDSFSVDVTPGLRAALRIAVGPWACEAS